jgi:hypothetical protein
MREAQVLKTVAYLILQVVVLLQGESRFEKAQRCAFSFLWTIYFKNKNL